MIELVIDNFAGGGGASFGIEKALGRPLDIAINHDRSAIRMHELNHPGTRHYCQDIWSVDPLEACAGRPVGLAWFSPDCRHFSKAKGGKPVEKKIRDLAWVVLRWASKVRPRILMLENVEEFRTWGPLGPDNRPIKERMGETFGLWVSHLRNLGYAVEYRELVAADYGAPTTRKRLFLIARRDGRPIVWPERTHAPAGDPAVKDGRLLPWRAAWEIIDWSRPCPSIFERKKPLAENTLRRIAHGIMRYVVNAEEPFIVTNTTGHAPSSIQAPLPTLATGNHQYLASARLAGALARGEAAPAPAHRTETASPDAGPLGAREARPPRTARGGRGPGLFAPHVTKFRSGAVGSSIEEPLPTVTANSFQKRPGGCAPIGVVSAYLAKHYGGPNGHLAVGSSLESPAPTVTAQDHNAVVEALLAPQQITTHGTRGGRRIDEPVPTLCGSGGLTHAGMAAAFLTKFRGTSKDGQDARLPMPALTGQGNHVAEVRAFLVKYYKTATARPVTLPFDTLTAKARFGLVTVEGEPYEIADIGMRMLEPRELFRAQGFPDSYQIDGFTKSEQVRLCGNSVCPSVAEALVRANYAEAALEKSA